ncbi:MAG: M28 family peptidase [Fibrella sp.]|nr:M28 family peptidase [Armatimonadota bacterium]
MDKASGRLTLIGAVALAGLAGGAWTLSRRLRGRKLVVSGDAASSGGDSGGVTGTTPNAVAGRLESHVRMLAETLSPRDHHHTENLDRVAAYIRAELEQAGGRTSEQTYRVDGKTYHNVVAAFGPETPERVVVGAHYDAAGPYPAADDNASGVAGLIELAHRLKDTQLPLRVEMVAFTLEEPPHFGTDRMGSAVHAASLRKKGVAVRAMISLEMIGYFSDKPNSQDYPVPALKATYPSEGNFIAVVGRADETAVIRRIEDAMRKASALPVRSLAAPATVPGIALSDHRNYWDAGYPAVMITDTSYYRNPNYHTPHDKPETLDYDRMALVVDGVHSAIQVLCE